MDRDYGRCRKWQSAVVGRIKDFCYSPREVYISVSVERSQRTRGELIFPSLSLVVEGIVHICTQLNQNGSSWI